MVENNRVLIRKFVFGMVHIFRTKNLLGKKDGYLSKKSLILMLLTWMIKYDLIKNAQGVCYCDPEKPTVERKPARFRPKNI
jgi:hypothetical protein